MELSLKMEKLSKFQKIWKNAYKNCIYVNKNIKILENIVILVKNMIIN